MHQLTFDIGMQAMEGKTRIQAADALGISMGSLYRYGEMFRQKFRSNAAAQRISRAYEAAEIRRRLKEEWKRQVEERVASKRHLRIQPPSTVVRLEKTVGRVERANEFAALYEQGKTLAEIGEQFGVSRERVRQLLAFIGVDRKSSGRIKKSQLKQIAKEKAKEDRILQKYGVTGEEWKKAKEAGYIDAYRRQKQNASNRGIGWELNFAQWMQIWTESGKLHERGRSGDSFVMSRKGDVGPYSVDNVEIKTLRENSSEAFKHQDKNKEHKGVFLIVPGCSKPWMAKRGRKNILGYFATKEEAVAARERYIAEQEAA